ncbi:hypothetical protein FT643_02150 [Ketobacter sp. MCCC 1A13808]|uniref:hypothetical protein n=1 Tax=Ketobacter sp. MCCC 1A13808 TaxID=2602738 RepID=UPI0012EB3F22|nr:hypothetical protein [Ketobacter sp. MCCC 1A13808]MVF10934.1 hypothetical protein [Ketobacter sp. MCCC 1A13808]
MKYLAGIGLIALTGLQACSTNTKVDDGSYRAIGHQEPRQRQNHAAAYAGEAAADKADAAYDHYAPESEYSDDAYQNSGISDMPGKLNSRSEPGNAKTDARNQHLYRYGHPRSVEKIVQTAEIHCRQLSYQISTKADSFWGKGKGALTQCSYQFPQFCGAHRFSVVSYEEKRILIFQPEKQTHYVIDTLEGTPKSQPGLWDQDDHLGSARNNANYLFNSDYNQNYDDGSMTSLINPVSLGWIIKASLKDEQEYGKLYHKAVKESTACF